MISFDDRQPPQGTVRAAALEIRFQGWLGLMQALFEALGSPVEEER